MKILFLLLILSISINAQTYKLNTESYIAPQNHKSSFCNKQCWYSLGIYSAGSTVEIWSSAGQKEYNPLVRDKNGTFTLGRGILFKSIVGGVTLAAQKEYPKAMIITRYVLGALYIGVGIRNFVVTRKR